jgi:hypothetical protein
VFSSGLYRLLERNYGHAGPMFIQRLLTENHEALANTYHATRMELRAKHPNSLESHVDAVSCVVLADYLASQWIFGDIEPKAGCESIQMGELILAELIGKSGASETDRGWDWLQDWVAVNQHRFEQNSSYDKKSYGDIIGYSDETAIYLIKTELSNALRDAGFSPEKLYRQWHSEGKIPCTPRPDGRIEYGMRGRRMGGAAPWLIAIKKQE